MPIDHAVKDIDGRDVSLSSYRGQALLIVNVASKCGYTRQYAGLEALHEELAPRGFAVLGFPCNDFGAQEPGTEAEIKQFCGLTYGVKFPMFAKVKVKGDGKAALYADLTAAQGGDVKWNFTKFLVSKAGEVVGRFEPGVEPNDAALRAAIERELSAS